jgi:hypothetical protein
VFGLVVRPRAISTHALMMPLKTERSFAMSLPTFDYTKPILALGLFHLLMVAAVACFLIVIRNAEIPNYFYFAFFLLPVPSLTFIFVNVVRRTRFGFRLRQTIFYSLGCFLHASFSAILILKAFLNGLNASNVTFLVALSLIGYIGVLYSATINRLFDAKSEVGVSTSC